jgi:hypothetical protein
MVFGQTQNDYAITAEDKAMRTDEDDESFIMVKT